MAHRYLASMRCMVLYCTSVRLVKINFLSGLMIILSATSTLPLTLMETFTRTRSE